MTNLSRLYNKTIRDYLPRVENTLQGEVNAKQARLLDATIDDPEYEAELIDAVRLMVSSGDTVVVVGGGWGVSAYFAAQLAEVVIVYEGSDTQLEYLEETVRMNDGTDNINIRPGYVGGIGKLYSKGEPVNVTPVKDIPDCDLLILDCEGAECHILTEIEHGAMETPSRMVVESHPMYGCPSESVSGTLDMLGYDHIKEEHGDTHVFSCSL